jgi:aminoglycoside phosphotransferase (APT) family kinase protein
VTLLHGDYHLQNVILTAGAADVGAVLDWELSTLGDPLADLGTLLAYWPRTSDDPVAELMAMSLPADFAGRCRFRTHVLQALTPV